MCGDGGIWVISVFSAQFYYEFKTALKIKCVCVYTHTWLFFFLLQKSLAHTLED